MSATDVPAREPDGGRGPSQTIAGVLAGVLVFLLVVLGLLWFGRGDGEPEDPIVASPLTPTTGSSPTATPAPTATPTPTPTTPSPSPGDSPTSTPEETEREPTDADAAAFTATYEPPGGRDVESVTHDLTGDGRPEIVVIAIAQEVVRVDVATWTGTEYAVTFSDQGGRADDVERFLVQDVGGDGQRDIVTVQTAGEERESLSAWGWDGEAFVRQEARGGCWDGSHTYGIVGVSLHEGEIHATCDGSPLPQAAWPTDVYVWRDGAWRHERTEEP